MEEVAIWKMRALEAEDLNRKFVAEINGHAYMGEPAQPTPSIPEGWKLMPIEPTHETLMDIVGVVTAPLSFREVRAIYDAMLASPEAKP